MNQLWPVVFLPCFFQTQLPTVPVAFSFPAEEAVTSQRQPPTPTHPHPQSPDTGSWFSQITPDSWHLNPDTLIPKSLCGPHWQECSQLWSWREQKGGVSSLECSLMTSPTEHSAPSVSPVPSLADSWLATFPVKPVPLSVTLNLPQPCWWQHRL